jgi:hypothetical protein
LHLFFFVKINLSTIQNYYTENSSSSPELISICVVQLTHSCLLALPPIAHVLVSVSIGEGSRTVSEVCLPLALMVEKQQQRERNREREIEAVVSSEEKRRRKK